MTIRILRDSHRPVSSKWLPFQLLASSARLLAKSDGRAILRLMIGNQHHTFGRFVVPNVGSSLPRVTVSVRLQIGSIESHEDELCGVRDSADAPHADS